MPRRRRRRQHISISNGLLPAALALGASTTQGGYDIAVTFGFYPGISTNDGSANLQQGAGQTNTALGSASIDMRQVFLTFGNDNMGQFLHGPKHRFVRRRCDPE